jgi:hypothetical protein
LASSDELDEVSIIENIGREAALCNPFDQQGTSVGTG